MALCAWVYRHIACTTPRQNEEFSKQRVFIHKTKKLIYCDRKFTDYDMIGKAPSGIQP